MRFQVLGSGLLSPWVIAIGLATLMPGCDEAQLDDEDAFRSGEFDDEDAGNADGLPVPTSIDIIEGAPVSGCPDCGSHWTKVDGEIVVHLAEEVADGVLGLGKKGRFFYLGGHGSVDPREAVHFGDGYSILVRPPSNEPTDALEPDYVFPRRSVLRFKHEDTPVDVRLRFIDSDTMLWADPPMFE